MRSVIQASGVSAIAIAGLLVIGVTPGFAADDLMVKIKKNGVVRLCTTDSPPVAAKDPKTNEWQGTYIDMANKFAASLNVKVEWVDSTWGTLVQYVTTGKCDISAAQTYITAVRAQQVLFTRPITANSQAIFVAVDSPAKTIEDLDETGKVVAVIAGSTNEKWAKETFSKATIKPIVTDRQSTPLLEVASKRADATMMAVIASMEVLDQNKNLKIRKLDVEPLFPIAEAWMLPYGEYHFQQYVNIWLDEFINSGEMKKLQKKWSRTN